ncbi:uncharacterized protein [Dysidea avara]|uniref:uncharacterized protein isoform X2 n=1 Tax=Dysidea avara TaxID=196820 RepID=UPI0033241D39
MKAIEVAKKIGYQTASDVNPTLYSLKNKGKVIKGQDGWSIEGAVMIPGISFMNLDGKDLYTHEEIANTNGANTNGRKEHRLRQMLREDLTPPKKSGNATSRDTTDGKQASRELNPETLSLLSSMFDDTRQCSQALKIVKLLRESVNKTVDDVDILIKLHYSTRQEYRHILDMLELNCLVKKIEGEITKRKWIADPQIHHGWYDATSLIVTDSLGALSSAKKTDTNVMYTAEQASVKFGIQELEKNENENMKLLNAVPSIHRKQEKKINKEMANFMLKACRRGETMKVRFGRVLFSGASGAGKTNFCNLLLRKAFQPLHISTGLHKYDRVSAIKISMQQSDNHVQFSVLDLEEEIDELRSHLNFVTDNSQGTDLSQSEESDGKYEEKTETDLNKLCSVERSIAKDSESNTRLPTFTKDDTWNILTFLDTGGQPQFISMLPAVNSCAMVTFIVHNMTNSLSSPVTVTHGNQKGELSSSPYAMGCTYLQLIRSLISFVGSNWLGRRAEDIFNDKDIIKLKNRSYVSFVGTHFDKFTEEGINELKVTDEELNFAVSDSPLSHVWKKVHKSYKVLIPVNNTTASTDDEDQCASVIRSKLYEVLCEQNTYKVPIVWLILELEIRQVCKERQNCAISYAEVVTLCREKKLLDKEDDIKNGLRFHHLFGTLLYFEDVVEMSDIIFTDLHWLFDKLTDIVELSCDNSDVKASQDFEHKGIFRSTMLDKLNFSINDINIINKDFKKSFLKFLEHLRIIAPIH